MNNVKWVRIRTGQPIDPTTYKPLPDIIKDIDWNDSGDRRWFKSHLHWAILNDRQVSVYKTPRAETPSREARHG